MSTISKTQYVEGQTPTAAQLNAPYDALASSTINDDNTASGWITRKHMVSSPNINSIAFYENPTTSQTTYNNTSYTTITQGGNPAEITMSVFPEQYEVMRFHACGLTGKHTVSTDYDGSLGSPNVAKPGYYAFSLLLTYNDGGGDLTQVLGEWGYGFTARGHVTEQSSGTADPINWQTFQFSAYLRYNGAPGAREYKKVELQVKVFDASNSVAITRHQLYALRAVK